jgi:uncharacterized protein YbjT (DUF2867 family)
MSEKRTIAIMGATGAQGGGLARAILRDRGGPFRVRAITRDPNSAKARALAELGAEVVRADIADEASLTRAFSGAYGAFLVSFFWHHTDAERDLAEIRNMAKAARSAEVRHAIYSTLEDTRAYIPLDDERMPTINGKYKSPHMDVKGEGDRFFTELGVPTSFLLTTFYWENFFNPGVGPARVGDRLLLTFPMADKILPGIATEDIGKAALGIFKNEQQYIGQKVGISGDQLTGKQYAAALSAALGKTITYQPPTHDQLRALNLPFGIETANSFQFMCDFNEEFVRARSLVFSRSVNPELQSFPQWLEANKHLVYDPDK